MQGLTCSQRGVHFDSLPQPLTGPLQQTRIAIEAHVNQQNFFTTSSAELRRFRQPTSCCRVLVTARVRSPLEHYISVCQQPFLGSSTPRVVHVQDVLKWQPQCPTLPVPSSSVHTPTHPNPPCPTSPHPITCPAHPMPRPFHPIPSHPSRPTCHKKRPHAFFEESSSLLPYPIALYSSALCTAPSTDVVMGGRATVWKVQPDL